MALMLLLSCQVSWQLCAFCDASRDHRVCDCNGQVEASIIAETGDVRLSNQSYVILRHAELSLLGALPVSAKRVKQILPLLPLRSSSHTIHLLQPINHFFNPLKQLPPTTQHFHNGCQIPSSPHRRPRCRHLRWILHVQSWR